MAITHSPFLMLPLILFFLLRLSPISATELSSPPLLPPLPKALLAFAEPPGALPQPAPSFSSCVSGIHPLLTNLTHLFLHFIQLLSKCLPHFSLFLPKSIQWRSTSLWIGSQVLYMLSMTKPAWPLLVLTIAQCLHFYAPSCRPFLVYKIMFMLIYTLNTPSTSCILLKYYYSSFRSQLKVTPQGQFSDHWD